MPIFVTKQSSGMPMISMIHGGCRVDFQSGSGNSSTIGFVWSINDDCQVNPAIYVTNDSPHEVLGHVSFTYTFHVWRGGK